MLEAPYSSRDELKILKLVHGEDLYRVAEDIYRETGVAPGVMEIFYGSLPLEGLFVERLSVGGSRRLSVTWGDGSQSIVHKGYVPPLYHFHPWETLYKNEQVPSRVKFLAQKKSILKIMLKKAFADVSALRSCLKRTEHELTQWLREDREN